MRRLILKFTVAAAVALAIADSGRCPTRQGLDDGFSPKMQRVADAITLYERTPRWLHNPGALVYARQAGARRSDGAYAAFADDVSGRTALLRDLRAKARRGMNLGETMHVWNPTGECYGVMVSRETGISRSEVLR